MERIKLEDIVEVGDAVAETRGDAVAGREDTITSQYFLGGGIDRDN